MILTNTARLLRVFLVCFVVNLICSVDLPFKNPAGLLLQEYINFNCVEDEALPFLPSN